MLNNPVTNNHVMNVLVTVTKILNFSEANNQSASNHILNNPVTNNLEATNQILNNPIINNFSASNHI